MFAWKLLGILFIGITSVKSSDSDVAAEAEVYLKEMKDSEDANPKTPTNLAYETLKKGFENANPQGISFLQIMEILQNLRGPERYYALRMYEKMDENGDGQITASEMAFVFDHPVSSGAELFKYIFKVKDFDGNGFVTPWEVLREKMILEGNNLPISTLWRHAIETIKIDDLDNNGVLDLEEFMLGLFMKIDMSIVHARRKEKGLNPNGKDKKARKFSRKTPVLRRAHKVTVG